MTEILIHDMDSAKEAIRQVADLFDDGQPFTVQFIPLDYEPYTTAQLNRAHAIFGEIAVATHHTVKEAKAAMMDLFYPETFFDFQGERVAFRKSFTDLSKADVSYLIDSTEAWAADNNIHLRK